jgi:hypothetical protein
MTAATAAGESGGEIFTAGFLEANARATAVATSKGLFAYHRSPDADYSVTAPTPDDTGSAWGPAGARGSRANGAPAIGQAPGLKAVVYGAVLIAFVMFEPLGIYGRWLKVRTYLQLFPFYRKGLFKRQKAFQKSDRLR